MKSNLTAIALLISSLTSLQPGFGITPADNPAPGKSTSPQTNAATFVSQEGDIDPRAGLPGKDVEIRSDQILATVNGKMIKGGDLVLFGEAHKNKPQTVSGRAYDQLLNHAIDWEIVRQAASAEEITLTDDQRKKLEALKEDVIARAKAPWSGAMHFNGTPEEEAQFEQREEEGQMLLINLMTKKGVSPPHKDITDEQVKQHYDAHKDEFDPMPKDEKAKAQAWKTIDYKIRRFYALTAVDAYSAECRKAIAEWKSKAEIDIRDNSK